MIARSRLCTPVPELRVAITRPPGWLGARTGFAVAGLADALEHVLGPPVHPQLAPWLGFRAEYATVRACRTPEALADLVLASSCTPPLTPLLMQGGKPSLDGGIADNVPVAALADAPGATLVLLARRYGRLPAHSQRVYAQPSADVPVASWDYTNPAGLQAAYDLGRRDGEIFARRMDVSFDSNHRRANVLRTGDLRVLTSRSRRRGVPRQQRVAAQ